MTSNLDSSLHDIVSVSPLGSNADAATLNINLDVTYELNDTPLDKIKEVVESNLRSVIGLGLLTNDLPGPATVLSWELDVTEVPYEETPDVYLGPETDPIDPTVS